MFLMVSGVQGSVLKEDRWMMAASVLKGVRLAVAEGDFDDRQE